MQSLKIICICFTLSVVFDAANSKSSTFNENCPIGWIDSIEGCFFFNYQENLTWRQSQLECQNLGGYLAEPKTTEQQSLLTSLAYVEQSQLGSISWWIGLTDQGHENRWVWQHSVEDAILTNWDSGYPDENNAGNDCVALNSFNEYKWTDENCDAPLASPICQFNDMGLSSTSPPTTTPEIPLTTTSEMYRAELRNGTDSSGNVFVVNRDGYLGPVCDDRWSTNEAATVVCKQLGFSLGGVPTTQSFFGAVPSNFAMDEIYCTGVEAYLQNCDYVTNDDCESSEGAGVICNT